MRARVLIALVLALLGALAGSAPASQHVTLNVALTPEQLGHGTTIRFSFRVATPRDRVPSPLVGLNLSYPENFNLVASGLGLSDCSAGTLEMAGTEACPNDALMGHGSAIVEIPFGPTIVREIGHITTLMAPVQSGRVAMIFFAEGKAPVLAQLIFTGLIEPAGSPFGGRLDTRIPLIPSLPEIGNGAVVQMTATIGPIGVTYYRRVGDRSVGYPPPGLHLPSVCPRGGFPFAATFTFLDGSHSAAHTVVRCPRHR